MNSETIIQCTPDTIPALLDELHRRGLITLHDEPRDIAQETLLDHFATTANRYQAALRRISDLSAPGEKDPTSAVSKIYRLSEDTLRNAPERKPSC